MGKLGFAVQLAEIPAIRGLRRFTLDPGTTHEDTLGLHHTGVSRFPCLSIFLEVFLVLFLPQ